PILWWSPDPRGVIELYADQTTNPDATPGYGGLHVSRRLARTLRSGKFRVTVNQCFEEVMRACGSERPEGTWVFSGDMVPGYAALHRLGHAHSVETWIREDGDGPALKELLTEPFVITEGGNSWLVEGSAKWRLAGGVYGVAIGGVFAAESMFYRVTDGSKVALAALVSRLRERGFALLDVQMKTAHTGTMGATEVPRKDYLKRLRAAVEMTGVSFV
ncbi:MAG: leucyl/phenylalanyl-tRNA--protein transferase, partial [Gemmataceae bacterium]|nr:leucyl/phenylalanyl-tRNA--protein transferase [Gemmataceae bacterium]